MSCPKLAATGRNPRFPPRTVGDLAGDLRGPRGTVRNLLEELLCAP
jgi:hypothetical protein